MAFNDTPRLTVTRQRLLLNGNSSANADLENTSRGLPAPPTTAALPPAEVKQDYVGKAWPEIRCHRPHTHTRTLKESWVVSVSSWEHQA